jgi:hypothetical protein
MANHLSNNNMHYISRIDNRATHGYWVRLFQFADGNGMTFQKFFPDLSCGGKRKALSKAKTYRDKKMKVMPKMPLRIYHERISPRNTTGVIGVQLITRYGPDGTPNYYYAAGWYEQKYKKISKCFAVLKYGEDEAFNLACEARAEGIKGIEKVRRKFKKAVQALQLPP